MKGVVRTLVVVLLNSALGYGQVSEGTIIERNHEVDVFYYNSHIGNQIIASFNYHINRHAIIGGLQYHFNSTIRRNNSRFDDWEIYNLKSTGSSFRSFLDHLGFTLGYEYHLIRRVQFLDPYLFFQLQPTSSLAARFRDPSNPVSVRSEGNYFVVEAIGGIGIQRSLLEHVSINGSLGLGTASFLTDGKLTINEPDTPYNQNFTERAIVYRIGLSYIF